MRAAKEMTGAAASIEFDDAFTSHIGHTLSNGVRAFVHGITSSRLGQVPRDGAPETRHYYRFASRMAAAFAFLADVSMLAMGGALKRKEKISGRLGDVLSMLYLVSATLKHYEDQGRHKEDIPLIRWVVRDLLYHAQEAIDQILSNFPVKSAGDAAALDDLPARHVVPPAARLAQPRVREDRARARRGARPADRRHVRAEGRNRPDRRRWKRRSSPPSPASRSTRSCARR